MRYLIVFVLMLAGCAYNATLIPRGGGQTLIGVYSRAGLEMTVDLNGETYRGRVVQGQSSGIGFSGTKSAAMVGFSNQFSSTMVGPKGVVRCDFSLGGTGGNGVCQDPAGTMYDLILQQ